MSARYAVDNPIARALDRIARRFKLHLRLMREMHRDGHLRIEPEIPDFLVAERGDGPDKKEFFETYKHYGISRQKFAKMFNAGYVNLAGLDYKKVIQRYLQRHSGSLSVRLLCYLAYDEVRSVSDRLKNHTAYTCLSALKIEGKLNPPKHLEQYLDAACRGHPVQLEHVARWMRDLIESIGKPHVWAFFGVRLALVEGSYGHWDRPIPKLRKWAKRRKLARLLREHPLLRGCVTPVARPGRNKDFFYVFHPPGTFWDL